MILAKSASPDGATQFALFELGAVLGAVTMLFRVTAFTSSEFPRISNPSVPGSNPGGRTYAATTYGDCKRPLGRRRVVMSHRRLSPLTTAGAVAGQSRHFCSNL